MDNDHANINNIVNNQSAVQETQLYTESSENATINDDNATHSAGVPVPAIIPSPVGLQPSQSMDEVVDALMEDIEYVDMPPLQDVSDSDDDRDAYEVEMQAVDAPDSQPSVPLSQSSGSSILASMSSTSVPSPRPQRRARVEEDHDEERDRRHPSQRLGTASSTPTSSSAPSGTPAAPAPHTHAPSAPNPSIPPQGLPPIFMDGFSATQLMDSLQAFLPPLLGAFTANPTNSNNNPPNGDTNAPPVANPQPPPNGDNPGTQNNNNANNRPPGFATADGFAVSISMGEDGLPRVTRRPLNIPRGAPPNGDNPSTQNDNNTNDRPPPLVTVDGFALSITVGEDGQPRVTRRALNAQERGAAGAGNFPMPMPMTGVPGPANLNAQLNTAPIGSGAPGFGANPGFNFNFANLAPFFVGLGPGGYEEREDPERAKKLVEGLEDVPVGLVRRLERVGGTGGGMGEDESRGGDGGCAICWDRLLPEDASLEETIVQADNKDGSEKKEEGPHNEDESKHDESDKPTETEIPGSDPETKLPRVVSLPCAHVFHADCLIPWFSRPRHTTCPTCRFNIDPENLTYVRRRRERPQTNPAQESQSAQTAQTGEEAAPNAQPTTEGAPAAVDVAANPQQPQLPQQGQGFWFGDGANGGIMGMGMVFSGPLPGDVGPLLSPTTTALAAGDAPAAPTQAPSQPQANPPPAANTPGGPGVQIQTEWVGAFTIPMTIGGTNVQGGAGLGAGTGGNPFRSPFGFTAPGAQPPAPRPADPPLAATATGGASEPPASNENAAPTHTPVTAPWQTSTPTPTTNSQPHGPQPAPNTTRHPRLSDVRVTIDVVFDGGPFPGEGPIDGPPAQGGNPETMPLDDDDEDIPDLLDEEDLEDRMLTQEEMEANERQFQELFTVLDRNRRRWQDRPEGATPPAGDLLGVPPPAATADDGTIHGFNSGPQPELPFPIPRAPQVTTPPQQQPAQQPPQQPPTAPTAVRNVASLPGLSFVGGTEGSNGFSMMFDGFPPPRTGQTPSAAQEGAGQPAAPPATGQPPPAQVQMQAGRRLPIPARFPWPIPMPLNMNPSDFMRSPRPEGPKRPWSLPPAPGPTLRQRVERREREAGLRCDDVSCGLGPSDEDPLTDEAVDNIKKMLQVSIEKTDVGEDGSRSLMCEHKFHASCLVSAARVALRDADAAINEDGTVDVSCPVCRHDGCLMKKQWEEGVKALE